MKRNEPLARLACLVLFCSGLTLLAEETAVVKDGRVNVRGQPSLAGEVITQVQKGERVIVLEEITPTKVKTNEPPRWLRIQMPANTPVWVHSGFLDSNKTVKVDRLNLRAGPGENYSVVGRIPKGTTLKEIRQVGDWIEIETPPGAYAFVAADLLTKPEAGPATTPGAAPAVAENEPAPSSPALRSEPAPPPVEQTKPAAPAEAPAVKTEETAKAPPPQPPATTQKPAEMAAVPAAPPEKVTTEGPSQPILPAPPTAQPGTGAAPAPPSDANKEEALRRRIVRREGIVRSTVSIQAPTYYELLSPSNRKTINYLHTDNLAVNLKDYRGRLIIVTGEEAIDPRWPKTPVIEVETLELIP